MMKKTNYRFITILAWAIVLLTACQAEQVIDEKSEEVNFNVATYYEGAFETRTEYSGYIQDLYSVKYERINWVAGDMIRIVSDVASTSSGDKEADYTVLAEGHLSDHVSGTMVGLRSNALISTSTPMFWSAGENTFYGLYPAPETSGVDAGVSFSESGVATLVLPSDQSNVDMKYAYMGAASIARICKHVPLNFKPLMNAIHFEFYAAEDVDVILKSLTLEAMDESVNLTGTYTASLAPVIIDYVTYTTYTVGETVSNGSHVITASFGEGGAGLPIPKPSSGTPWSKTFFTIPQTLSCGLKITLEVSENGEDKTRSLELKNGDDWIEIAQGQKINITSTLAVTWDYTLTHNGTTITLDDGTEVVEIERFNETAGTTNTAVFESYKSADGGVTKKSIDVTYDFAEADSETGLPVRIGGEIAWSSAIPEGMNISTPVTISGETISKTIQATLLENPLAVTGSVNTLLKHAENLKSRTAVGSSDNPYDLSMYDIHGTSRSNQPVTANCYIVDRAGWYMFPLVYGNAIDYTKSGASGTAGSLYNHGVNAYAYQDAVTPAANTNSAWHTFQNFTGTSLISTPYILDDAGSLSSSDVEAVVVWQDVESATYSFIENVDVVNISSSGVFYDPRTSAYKTSVPYIKFQVPEGNINPDETMDPLQRVTGIREGNALIAVRLKAAKTINDTEYAAGTILWSWHIWVSDGYDTDGDNMGDGLSPIPVTNYTGVEMNMMPMDLGWCNISTLSSYEKRVWYVRVSQIRGTAEPIIFRVVQRKLPMKTANNSSGTFYQWGRKDPFIPSGGATNNINKNAYSPANYTLFVSDTEVNYSSSPTNNASSAIQNPITFYYNDWMNAVYSYNLWNMANGSNGTSDVAVSKTVYDPCPPGYCIPRKNAFTRFNTTGQSSSGISYVNAQDRNDDGSLTSADFDYEQGWYFYTNSSKSATIFFPAAGYRGTSTSKLNGVAICTYQWTAGPESTRNISSMYFANSYVRFRNYRWGLGCTVRPTQE